MRLWLTASLVLLFNAGCWAQASFNAQVTVRPAGVKWRADNASLLFRGTQDELYMDSSGRLPSLEWSDARGQGSGPSLLMVQARGGFSGRLLGQVGQPDWQAGLTLVAAQAMPGNHRFAPKWRGFEQVSEAAHSTFWLTLIQAP